MPRELHREFGFGQINAILSWLLTTSLVGALIRELSMCRLPFGWMTSLRAMT